MPHYFFRKKSGASLFLQKKIYIFSQEIMRHFIFSEGIIRHFIFFWRNNEASDVFTAEIRVVGLLRLQDQVPDHFYRKNERLRYFFRKNEAPHYFFRKKWSASVSLQKKCGASLCLQKKMRLLIISSEKNEAPHYFFRKDADFFLKK